MDLPSGTRADTCRFMLSVGTAQTLTRAFVYSTTEPIIIDCASETAVALILGKVQQGTDLCGFSAAAIRSLVSCIRSLPGDVTGPGVAETNRNAMQVVYEAILHAGAPCLDVSIPVATVTPTPPPASACVPIPCGGDCVVRPPCAPDTACPQYVVKGTCEVVYNSCMCVTNSQTPPPTPTFGGCGVSCDERACSGQCADGSTVQGSCTSLTVDRGCACALECGPTRTPTPLAVCTPPPCKTGEVFSCPGNCPGGCGTLCATPTNSPTITATPTPITETLCGQLFQGVECVLFQADNDQFGGLYSLSNTGGFHAGDRVCVTGTPYACVSICQQGNLCLNVTAVEAAPTLTPTPTGPPTLSCLGDCSGDGVVTVDEIIRLVTIVLNGASSPNACPGSEQWFNPNSLESGIAINCVIAAVNNALNGCPTVPRRMALAVHVVHNPDTQILQAVAHLTTSGAVPVAYLTGCSALCRPKVYRAISFAVVGPHNTEVVIEEPCGGVLLCPESPHVFSPGDSVEQALDITGTEWKQDATPTSTAGKCGSCSQAALEPGRYTVTARFQYSTDLNNPWPFPDYIEASAGFD